MTKDRRYPDPSGEDRIADENTAGKKAETVPGDACRCKEVARKTPAELLKLALDDLAFWKKRGHHNR